MKFVILQKIKIKNYKNIKLPRPTTPANHFGPRQLRPLYALALFASHYFFLFFSSLSLFLRVLSHRIESNQGRRVFVSRESEKDFSILLNRLLELLVNPLNNLCFFLPISSSDFSRICELCC